LAFTEHKEHPRQFFRHLITELKLDIPVESSLDGSIGPHLVLAGVIAIVRLLRVVLLPLLGNQLFQIKRIIKPLLIVHEVQ